MNVIPASPVADSDEELCARAAWLYYGAGLTQGEVAKRLNIPGVKAHRLVARANRLGLVRVTIDAPVAKCIALEDALRETYKLAACVVAPEIDADPMPLRALGLAGSRFLQREIERGAHAAIGVGHGRTLAACVANLPRVEAPTLELVTLLGGMTRRYVSTPFDVVHRLAERTNAIAYVLPLPFIANSVEDRAVLMEQRGVGDVFAIGVASTLRFVGVGAIDEGASLLSAGLIHGDEFEELRAAGGIGELLGHFFAADGAEIENSVSARVLSMSLADIRRSPTVAVAGGRSKVGAIRAVLASNLLSGLITDEVTAEALLARRGRAKRGAPRD